MKFVTRKEKEKVQKKKICVYILGISRTAMINSYDKMITLSG